MNQYKVVTITTVGSPQWHWEFSADNDDDAITMVNRVMEADFQCVRWTMSLDLWTTSTEDNMVTFGYERHVANFRLCAPTARVKRANT